MSSTLEVGGCQVVEAKQKSECPLETHNARDSHVKVDVTVRGYLGARKPSHGRLELTPLLAYAQNGEREKHTIRHDDDQYGQTKERQIRFAIANPTSGVEENERRRPLVAQRLARRLCVFVLVPSSFVLTCCVPNLSD